MKASTKAVINLLIDLQIRRKPVRLKILTYQKDSFKSPVNNRFSKNIQDFKPFGYCLSGGMEEKTGLKSFEELDEIFDKLSDLASK
jgi:hypothetical protein